MFAGIHLPTCYAQARQGVKLGTFPDAVPQQEAEQHARKPVKLNNLSDVNEQSPATPNRRPILEQPVVFPPRENHPIRS